MDILDLKITGNRLTFTIGVDALCHAVTFSRYWEQCANDLGREPIITDPYVFTKEILRELRRESEDGSTPITRLLDKAAEKAIESGCEGIDYD